MGARAVPAGNYIDAMAMVRTAVLRPIGGYATDRRLHGWEDYDLWLTLAELGYRGVLVPAIVGRYRVSSGSMLSQTNVSTVSAFAALAERHRRFPGPRRQRPDRRCLTDEACVTRP